MLPFKLDPLSDGAMSGLRDQQAKVDSEKSHAEKYAKAKTLFSSKSPALSFREIKEALKNASPPGEACYYCERDRYRDIEHVKPKRHYPERTFDWFNYVYACAICNQDAKKDTYAVFVGDTEILEFNRSLPFTEAVPQGDPVLIDPRSENPLEYLQLDLQTGSLVAMNDSPRAVVRGNYTRDLFDLDAADLVRIRRNHVKFYLDRCRDYVACMDAGDEAKASRILDDLMEMEHPTVIVEMRRQAPHIPAIAELFRKLPPEVGAWPRTKK